MIRIPASIRVTAWRWGILLCVGCSGTTALTVAGADLSTGVTADLSAGSTADMSVHDSSPSDSLLADFATTGGAGGPDGICTPGPTSTGVYDPDCLYLLGTLRPSFAGWNALVLPSQPNDYAVGFYGPFFGDIRPSDGRLVYLDQSTAVVFQPSYIPTTGSFPPPMNQEVSTPACPHMVGGVFVFPDDSTAAYECLNLQQLYLEGQSTVLYKLDPHPIALGAGRVVLGTKSYAPTLFTPTGNILVTNPWTNANATPVAARHVPDGFLVAVENNVAPIVVKQVKVTLDGAATVVGSYQLGSYAQFQHCRMGPAGEMECTYEQPFGAGTIARFTLNAAPQVIYDDTNNPVKIFASDLVTGP